MGRRLLGTAIGKMCGVRGVGGWRRLAAAANTTARRLRAASWLIPSRQKPHKPLEKIFNHG